MIVFDTTVLVYAKGADHPLRDPCRELMLAVSEGRLRATTTIEVVQEFAHVRARRRGRADAAGLARDYAELLAPLLVVGEVELAQGLTLFERSDAAGAFDAVLVAAAMAAGAEVLVSADAAFARVPGIEHVAPDADGVAALLSRT